MRTSSALMTPYDNDSDLRNLPDGITPSCGWPTGAMPMKHCVRIRLHLPDDFSYLGIIGIVQHQVAAGLNFGDGVLDAFGPNQSVHEH